jgi:aminoglycoside phosphotransferase family enzyme/predicted kinase
VSTPEFLRGLLRAEAFPHPVAEVQLVETHISWIVLTGAYAYKIKKPVRLEFLDFSTLELRRHYCHEELRLNRRLAPEIYESVIGIGGERDRPLVGQKPAFEYAVRMRQFPADAQLDRRLEAGLLQDSDLRALGRRIGTFHLNAGTAGPASRYGDSDEVRREAIANLDQLERVSGADEDGDALRALRRWTGARNGELSALFARRKAEGWIREGHGDLHLSNLVALAGGVTAFDCLEFAPPLRWIDVISDIAFLVMDLELRDRSDLAYAFLDGYLQTTGDYAGVALLDYYRVYRSLVRAKVAALRAVQVGEREGRSGLEAAAAPATNVHETRRRAHLALAVRRIQPRHPRLLLMHGYSGSGKSWLGQRLAMMLPAVCIRSDVERKRLAGFGALDASHSAVAAGLYGPGMTHRTYSRLERCVRDVLEAGENVVADASFLLREQRTPFLRLGRELGVPCTIVDCVADRAVLKARILDRETDASEADTAVLAHQLRIAEPLGPDEPATVVRTDAEVSLPPLVQRIRATG